MAFALSEHIRSLRKARDLTQEQLAEALGVTAGAVYKWESRLSLPELPMLVQLADFFDTSVDALIGYTIKDNRRDATLARLMDLRHAKDLRGVDEAERAVMRYPNCFAIVYQAAVMMQVFGLEQSDKALTARALELYERALLLTEQNTNSEISELTIHVAMAECDLMLGRKEKALETLKANNPMGLNNTMIGMWAITHCDRAEEAENYLSRALLENVSRLFTMTMGFLTLYEKQKRWNEARELARWMLAICEGLVRTVVDHALSGGQQGGGQDGQHTVLGPLNSEPPPQGGSAVDLITAHGMASNPYGFRSFYGKKRILVTSSGPGGSSRSSPLRRAPP